MVAFVADRAFIDREWLQLERPVLPSPRRQRGRLSKTSFATGTAENAFGHLA